MKVKALRTGYYDDTIRPEGAVFEVPEGTKARWFAPVGAPSEVTKAEGRAPKAAKASTKADPQTFSEITKKDGADLTPKGDDGLV